MRVTVSLEHRFLRTSDGCVFGETGLEAGFWNAYLQVFDEVRVFARLRHVKEVPRGLPRADAPGVSFTPVPYYVGLSQYLARIPALHLAAKRAADNRSAFVLRVPSQLGVHLCSALRAARMPFAVEVVGDPHAVFAPGAIDHPLRALLRARSTRQLAHVCRYAAAASYVTEVALQERYPCPGPTFAISSIRLEPDAFAEAPKTFAGPARRIIFVGTLEQRYKAPDILLSAVAHLVDRGEDLSLTIVGDGRQRGALERSDPSRRLEGRVVFRGWLPPGRAVREALDAADLFVLPSRTEGLPRAMIEAMARGLPCIGSSVGGIPELLDAEDLVVPGSQDALAAAIHAFIRDPARLQRAARRNLARAHAYASRVLGPRRRAFYECIRSATGG